MRSRQSVEPEPLVEQELDPRDRRPGRRRGRAPSVDRGQRHQRGVARRRPAGRARARPPRATKRAAVAAAASPTARPGARAGRRRPPARRRRNRSTVGPERERLRRDAPATAPPARPAAGRARNISSCTAAGTTRSSASIAAHVSAASNTSRAIDVRTRERGQREPGLVAQARQEADAGPVHDRVGDDGGDDLAPERVRRERRRRSRCAATAGSTSTSSACEVRIVGHVGRDQRALQLELGVGEQHRELGRR